jgi:glutamate--cysteine ligase catalytic subunit
MGFLIDATPLTWEQAQPYLEYIRTHGLLQFINIYNKVKDRRNDKLLWGDEIEYMVLRLDPENQKVCVSLRADKIITQLADEEAKLKKEGLSSVAWHPEYGNWMVEATPSRPYGGYASDLTSVVENMRTRRMRINSALESNEIALTIVAFPTFGVGQFTFPATSPGGISAESDCVSDQVINPHPRFGTLTANIRKRRGGKVDIKLPLYQDTFTNRKNLGEENGGSQFKMDLDQPTGTVASQPAADDEKMAAAAAGEDKGNDGSKTLASPTQTPAAEKNEEFVSMDCMAFGMGCCCLQVTFQARDIDESLRLYDQLAVLTPIFLALSAACPIMKGKIVDTDVRWSVIAGSVDDRTPAERGMGESRGGTVAGTGTRPIRKSRYDSIDSFISQNKFFHEKYNDLQIELDEDALKLLTDAGVPALLAQHIAHLWIRDPLVIYKERVEIDDKTEVDHFENIQSTNWQSVRWKPPPPTMDGKDGIGWRVEFRSTEVQLTEFENAAFSVIIALVSRVILFFDLNMYMPLSKVDENMQRAHKRGAVTDEVFFFRNHVIPLAEECGQGDDGKAFHEDVEDACMPMTIGEILMGKSFEGTNHRFPGLFPLIYAYLDIIECAPDTRLKIENYCNFLYMRSTGKLMTTATWMRKFVTSHPSYQNDSVVSDDIAYDLMVACADITSGKTKCSELFGDFSIHPHQSPKTDSSAKGSGTDNAPRTPTRKLRGASFREEVKTMWQCNLIKQLIEKYSSKVGDHTLGSQAGTFKSTTAYLNV